MKCPNCNNEMNKTSEFERRMCEDEDGFDFYHAYMKVFTHSCDACKIKFVKDEYRGPFSVPDKWILPAKLRPTEKQIKFAENIGRVLGLDTDELITKNQYWNFIKQNENEFKTKQENRMNSRREALYEEIGEYYDESWFC